MRLYFFPIRPWRNPISFFGLVDNLAVGGLDDEKDGWENQDIEEGEMMRLLTWAGKFFVAMEERLIEKQTSGWFGWGQTSENGLVVRLMNNAHRKDWVDVANLALILWARKQKEKRVK